MTEREYRDIAALREELEVALAMPGVWQAFQIIETRYDKIDALLDAPPTASVRLLSQSVGRKQVREELERMTKPWPEQQVQVPETFGTKYSAEDFDKEEE